MKEGFGPKLKTMGFGCLIAAIASIYYVLFNPFPDNGDTVLGLPLGKAIADPSLYSKLDLVVASGLRAPFYLYQASSVLYSRNIDVDSVFGVLFVVFLVGIFLSLWFLAREICNSDLLATIVTGLIAAAPAGRGALNWTSLPPRGFVTVTVALPVAFLSLYFVFRKRPIFATAIAGICCNIHPYVGLITFVGCACAILFDPEGESLRKKLTAIAVGGVLAAPTYLIVLYKLPANFISDPSMKEWSFYEQFRLYAAHVFIKDHWREGYGWFFLNFSAAIVYSNTLSDRNKIILRAIVGALSALLVLYVINTWWIQSSLVFQMFLFRVTYILKPLIFIVLAGAFFGRLRLIAQNGGARSWLSAVGIVGVAISALFENVTMAEALCLFSYGIISLEREDLSSIRRLSTFILIALGLGELGICGIDWWRRYHSMGSIYDSLVGINVICSLLLPFSLPRSKLPEVLSHPLRPFESSKIALAALLVVLGCKQFVSFMEMHSIWKKPASPRVLAARMRMSRPSSEVSGLFKWIRESTPKGSLFVVPPYSDNFRNFRMAAERGLYITGFEINVLSFDLPAYREGHRRLTKIGAYSTGMCRFDTSHYETLKEDTLRELADESVDYFITTRKSLIENGYKTVPVYDDGTYVVLNLSKSLYNG